MSEAPTPSDQSRVAQARLLLFLIAAVLGLAGGYSYLRLLDRRARSEVNHEVEVNREAQESEAPRVAVEHLTPEEEYDRGLKAMEVEGGAPDYELAARWFGLAAAHEHTAAQYEFARLLHFGLGVAADPTAARRFARIAAEKGFPPAVTLAGIWETTAEDGDTEHGLAWLNATAAEDDVWAQSQLALVYLEGRIESPDATAAVYWAERAYALAPADTAELRLLAWQKIPPASRRLTQAVLASQLEREVALPEGLAP